MTIIEPRPPMGDLYVQHDTTVGFGNVVRSEWTKVRSLRSSYVCAGLVTLAMLGLAIGLSARWAHQRGPVPDWFDAVNISLSGTYIAQVIVGTFGVMAISSEHTTGMIRATFAAVPQRRAVLAAKVLVVGVLTLAIGELLSFSSFVVGQAVMSHKGIGVSLSDPGALRSAFGAGLFLALAALLGLGIGAIIRHTAGAISLFFGVMFALDPIVDLLPTSWRNDLINYLPVNAGTQIFTTVDVKGSLAPWNGLAVFALYAAVALLAGFLIIDVRDA
jgi:ABC-2 type transport system permease protein